MTNFKMPMITLQLFILCLQALNSMCLLQITNVVAPSPLVVGSNGVLDCNWKADGSKIYSLKWYLGKDEFYRWTPAKNSSVQVFLKNVNLEVDLKESRKGRVSVKNVTLEAGEHILRCEISEEAPAFHTEFKEVILTIVDLPDALPNITWVKRYHLIPHEQISLNCTSPGAKPAANLSFYINEERAQEKWVYRYPTLIESSTGLETSVLSLQFPLLPRYLNKGYVAVKCVAEVWEIYWESTQVVVAGEIPQRASIMEGRASGGIFGWSDTSFLIRLFIIYMQRYLL